MADNMIRVAGRSDSGMAKPIKTDQSGNLQIVQSEVIGWQSLAYYRAGYLSADGGYLSVVETDKPTIIDDLEFSTNNRYFGFCNIYMKVDGSDEYAQNLEDHDGTNITDGWIPVSIVQSPRGRSVPEDPDWNVYDGDPFAYTAPHLVDDLGSSKWEKVIYNADNTKYKLSWKGIRHFPKGVKIEMVNLSPTNNTGYAINVFGRVFR